MLTSNRLVTIDRIRMMRRRARFAVLGVEALPERSNHFREPVHFRSSSFSAPNALRGKRQNKKKEGDKKKKEKKTRSMIDLTYHKMFNPFRMIFPQMNPANICTESPSRTSNIVCKNWNDWRASRVRA
jgi:hypothetical protein